MTHITNKEISPEGATVSFLIRDGDQIVGEHLAHVSADGVGMEDNTPVPVAELAAMLPWLLRVHAALFRERDE